MINAGVFMDKPGTVRLVPYLSNHVPQYHRWMCDPVLLAATESEPLSLEEEHENQQSWMRSLEKLTFIITVPASRLPASTEWAPVPAEGEPVPVDDVLDQPGSPVARFVPAGPIDLFTGQPPTFPTEDQGQAEPYVMVGDCNLFLLDSDEVSDDSEECSSEQGTTSESSAATRAAGTRPTRVFEVEVMVAETRLRRLGVAETAVRMIMQYALHALGATHFMAKILDDNEPSIRLFAGKLGFAEHKRVRVFNEIHYLRKVASPQEMAAWRKECGAPIVLAPITEAVSRNVAALI